MSATAAMWPAGAAYLDGRFMPVAEAMIPVTDWGYRRSDVTYDVVSVWDGAFFKLDDHLRRFRASMDHFRLNPRESDDDIRGILHELVRRTGLREAYVAMDCLRGSAPANLRRHPANARNYLRRIEETVGTPIDIISTGPDRDETIVLRDPFAA